MKDFIKDIVGDLRLLRLRHSEGARFLRDRAAARGLDISLSMYVISIIDRDQRRQIRIHRNHADYASDMILYFDYYFKSVEPFQAIADGDTYEIVDFSTPRYHSIRGYSEHPILCPSLAEPFQTCQQYLEFARIEPGQTVLDLGSYSGLTSIAFSRAVGSSGRVISLEPDPVNYVACRTNIELAIRVHAAEANIRLLPLAIAERNCTLAFSSEGAMGSSRMTSSGVSMVGNTRGTVIKVEAISLEGLVQREKLDRVDFVKMDIEGSEINVIESSESFFRRFRPRAIIEPHLVNGVLCDDRVSRQMEKFDYRVYAIEQTGVAIPLLAAEPAESKNRARARGIE